MEEKLREPAPAPCVRGLDVLYWGKTYPEGIVAWIRKHTRRWPGA